MSTILDIKKAIASYLGRNYATDLNAVNMPTPGINIDLGTLAINNARRMAERAHDFKYAETQALLNITSTGGLISAAYVSAAVTITGSLSPAVTGTWAIGGMVNGRNFYTITVSTVQYFLSYTGSQWNITTAGFTPGSNYWSFASTSANPSGTYTTNGSNTGSPVVVLGTALSGVKRIKYVSLPTDSGIYNTIEFVSADQFDSRMRTAIGRATFVPSATVPSLGYPLAYQLGQNILLAPSSATLPIVAQLNIIQWQPDYTADTDTDFFTQYAPDYLQWSGILEINKLFRRFAPRQEGEVDEQSIQAMADQSLQALITWDNKITKGAAEFTQSPFTSNVAYDAQAQPAPAQSAPPQ